MLNVQNRMEWFETFAPSLLEIVIPLWVLRPPHSYLTLPTELFQMESFCKRLYGTTDFCSENLKYHDPVSGKRTRTPGPQDT